MDILQQTGGVETTAAELGVSQSIVENGSAALLPAILGGFKKAAQGRPDGLEGLNRLLDQLGGVSLLDSVVDPQQTPVEKGNAVLGQIFGSKVVSRTVVAGAEQQTGISSELLKQMLPYVAMLVAGYMAKQSQEKVSNGGGLGSLIGGLLGGNGNGSSDADLGALLDLNGEGNALDDIIGRAGKLIR